MTDMRNQKEKGHSHSNVFEIDIHCISKIFGTEQVLDNLTLSLSSGNTYCVMAPSGSGKTTLFRILMGLEVPDSGQIYGLEKKRVSAVFQENRLLEGFNAIQNLQFVTGRRYPVCELTRILTRLLPEDSLRKPVHEFSGGMKRRLSIIRALLAPSDILIMDEPFTGLDDSAADAAAKLIKEYSCDKLVLFSTHQIDNAKRLSASIIHLHPNGHN